MKKIVISSLTALALSSFPMIAMADTNSGSPSSAVMSAKQYETYLVNQNTPMATTILSKFEVLSASEQGKFLKALSDPSALTMTTNVNNNAIAPSVTPSIVPGGGGGPVNGTFTNYNSYTIEYSVGNIPLIKYNEDITYTTSNNVITQINGSEAYVAYDYDPVVGTSLQSTMPEIVNNQAEIFAVFGIGAGVGSGYVQTGTVHLNMICNYWGGVSSTNNYEA